MMKVEAPSMVPTGESGISVAMGLSSINDIPFSTFDQGLLRSRLNLRCLLHWMIGIGSFNWV